MKIYLVFKFVMMAMTGLREQTSLVVCFRCIWKVPPSLTGDYFVPRTLVLIHHSRQCSWVTTVPGRWDTPFLALCITVVLTFWWICYTVAVIEFSVTCLWPRKSLRTFLKSLALALHWKVLEKIFQGHASLDIGLPVLWRTSIKSLWINRLKPLSKVTICFEVI